MKLPSLRPSDVEAVKALLIEDPSGGGALSYINYRCRSLSDEMKDDLFFTAENLAYGTAYESRFFKEEK